LHTPPNGDASNTRNGRPRPPNPALLPGNQEEKSPVGGLGSNVMTNGNIKCNVPWWYFPHKGSPPPPPNREAFRKPIFGGGKITRLWGFPTPDNLFR